MTKKLFTLAKLADLLQHMCRVEPSQDKEDGPLYYKISVHLVEDILKALRPAPVLPHYRETAENTVNVIERKEKGLSVFDIHVGKWEEGEIPEFQVHEHSRRAALITNPCEGWSGGSEDAADFRAGLTVAIDVARSLDAVV